MRLVLVTLALSLAVFMEVLDTTIANVAVPVIAGDLGAATTQGTWVITSFAVANAISIPLTGFMARRFGEVKVFVWSVIGFVIMSWLCGIAHNLELLVLFRVLQGFVAGPLIPLSAKLADGFLSAAKAHAGTGFVGDDGGGGAGVGPILGGWISDNWHWGWIFFINVPIGIAAAFVAWRQLRHRETETERTPVDYVGLMLMVLGVGALQMMLDRGKELDWFSSTEIIVLAVVAVVCPPILSCGNWAKKYPIVDLSLFKDRNFTRGCDCRVARLYALYGHAHFAAFGVANASGLHRHLGRAGRCAGGHFAGDFVAADRPLRCTPGYALVGYGKLFGVCLHFSLAHQFLCRHGFRQCDLAAVLARIGRGHVFHAFNRHHLVAYERPANRGRQQLVQFLARVYGRRGCVHRDHHLGEARSFAPHPACRANHPYSHATREAVQGMMQAGMSEQQAYGSIVRSISQQGFIIGSNEIFWVGSVLFVSMIAVIWFAKPPFGSGAGGGH